MPAVASLFAAAALVGLVLAFLEWRALVAQLAEPRPSSDRPPPISILKPLCGVDDGLWENLASFAALDHPCFEILLGIASSADAAAPIASSAARRWPAIFRVVVQRREAGLNPKVSQLCALAAEARHDLLVVSDSNVRVDPGYLREIAALLSDPEVGLVTHPIAGVGERSLGALMDNLQLAGGVSNAMAAAKRIAHQDLVVGKSMALRRGDLRALGGFESVADVLAEDYVLGRRVPRELGKRVEVARRPVLQLSSGRGVLDFWRRYRRWGVMQKSLVGPWVYFLQLLLNPVLLSLASALIDPSFACALGVAACWAAKAALDGAAGRALRAEPFRLVDLALVPFKDLVLGAAWASGLFADRIEWRGHRLRVGPGSVLSPVEPDAPAPAVASLPAP